MIVPIASLSELKPHNLIFKEFTEINFLLILLRLLGHILPSSVERVEQIKQIFSFLTNFLMKLRLFLSAGQLYTEHPSNPFFYDNFILFTKTLSGDFILGRH